MEVREDRKAWQNRKLDEEWTAASQHPKAICLIGSTQRKWKDRYRKVEEYLTHAGFVVLTVVWFKGDLPSVEVCGKLGCGDFESHRPLLEKIHYQKIRLADAVVLIHEDAKGKNTLHEMKFAKEIGKPVITFDNIDQAKTDIRGALNGH